MKNSVFCIALLLLPLLCRAQVVYTDTTELIELKKTTTVFVIPEGDSSRHVAFEKAIATSWKFTPYIIVPANRLPQYLGKDGYSFFCEICSRPRLMQESAPAYSGVPVSGAKAGAAAAGLAAGLAVGIIAGAIEQKQEYKMYYRASAEDVMIGAPGGYYSLYELFIPQSDNDHDMKHLRKALVDEDRQPLATYLDDGSYLKHYAVINMGLARRADLYAQSLAARQKIASRHGSDDTLLPDEYWNTPWNPGMLKAYLLEINRQLAATQAADPNTDYTDTTGLKELKNDTLYIPDYVACCISDLSPGALDSGQTDADVQAAYPFPYRFVSVRQLSDMIISSGRPICFLNYEALGGMPMYYKRKMNFVGRGLYRNITIYNSQSGILYTKWPRQKKFITNEHTLTTFSTKDLEDVANVVESAPYLH